MGKRSRTELMFQVTIETDMKSLWLGTLLITKAVAKVKPEVTKSVSHESLAAKSPALE
jgi:hypothetical protein